jgi:uncharacterized membrane protein
VTWGAILVLAAGTYALKSAGPLLLGDRPLPPRLARLVTLLPPALLAALVCVQALAVPDSLRPGARLAGVAVAALLALRGAPFLVVVVAGCAGTALARALGS